MNDGLKILVVDDAPLIAKRLQKQLLELDYTESVLLAANFNEAIEIIEQDNVHVALLDINLPGKNGIELLKFITKQSPDVRCVMITNQEEPHYRNVCTELGCYDFLDKTKDIERLPEIVSEIAANCKYAQSHLYTSP